MGTLPKSPSAPYRAYAPRSALSLRSWAGDSLLFESDTLRDYALISFAAIDTPVVHNRVQLHDGTTLVLDSSTAEGTYRLADGGSIVLSPSHGYPRYYGATPRPNRALFFSIHSSARVAALVDPAAGSSLSLEQAEDELMQRLTHASRWPTVVHSPTAAFEFPRDWYRRASIEFEPTLADSLRVTWIAYGQAPPPSPQLVRDPQTGSYSMPRAIPKGSLPEPGLPSAELLRGTGRIIGELIVEPRTRRVVMKEAR